MNKLVLRIAAIGGLVVATLAPGGCGRSASPGRTPEAAVDEFFDAAAHGDDAAYLRLTSGELRESLESARSELGADEFRNSLRRSAAGIKGLAKTRSDDASLAGPSVALDVELVFADRNERQRMLLVPQGNGWVITSIGTAQTIQPPVRYGTPVFEEPDRPQGEQPARQ